ncbi:ferritin-like domain-containing protein [Nocardioides cynanchi]|uniref:ferritin-like domain-containing protein n=1 Tax=Nocardioides cynanchi TaxID=2558918 RepID=UPI001247358E|nr:ferritin-like domain-containing protein [Nocardioides cynanchi]
MSELDALQQTLAAEHAAVYVFGVLGGRAAGLPAPVLRAAISTAYAVHAGRRDDLTATITSTGADPVPAEPAYRVSRALTTPTEISAEALRVERACLTSYGVLVAASTGTNRTWAVDALVETATSELGFGGSPEPLPGMDTEFPGS